MSRCTTQRHARRPLESIGANMLRHVFRRTCHQTDTTTHIAGNTYGAFASTSFCTFGIIKTVTTTSFIMLLHTLNNPRVILQYTCSWHLDSDFLLLTLFEVKDPGAELLHMCFWHMDSDLLLAVRVALKESFHIPITIRTETRTEKKK